MTNFEASNLVQLEPRRQSECISMGGTVLIADPDGLVPGHSADGLFVSETRVLSRLRYLIDGELPQIVATSRVEQHSWLGYYAFKPETTSPGLLGAGKSWPVSEQTIELRVSRSVGDGMHEDIDIVNYAGLTASFELAIEVDADFADIAEAEGERQQHGTCSRHWRGWATGGVLEFTYHAEHDFDHQDVRGHAHVDRGVRIHVDRAASAPYYQAGAIRFDVKLLPHQSWHACMLAEPSIDQEQLWPTTSCYAFRLGQGCHHSSRTTFLHQSTAFSSTHSRGLAGTAIAALGRAKRDLVALRRFNGDDDRAWTVDAGIPKYMALFGRDTLTAGWQAALAGPELMCGTLTELARWQATEYSDWRDEQPNRMLHEAHAGPLSMLNFNPHQRYYGTVTAAAVYPIVVAELWHWTGREDLVRPFINPALRSLEWLDTWSDHNHDGFYDYLTTSTQGLKNQGWKDSGDAIVDARGHIVEPPIATSTEQGYVYGGKMLMAEIQWWLGDRDRALALYREAESLKRRFNDTFWMEAEQFVAMGLDPAGVPIRSIASGAGHAMASGILDESHVRVIADRLMADDMFSGWGIRTLSADHPAYDPFSYHRGSVWPVEQGVFALGFYRFGLYDHMHRLARAIVESAGLFRHLRLPEVFSGHARDPQHPFPAFYPKTNAPQAWSASAMLCLLQALLGLYPYAPLNLLLVDPHLPDWLGQLTVEHLRVGSATVSIAFERTEDGSTSFRVLETEGTLHVVRQASPWSLTAGKAERVRDALMSLLPTR